jgi:endogenous inhibitor of DNA gyrase (YacG/DUF329 family)
MSDLAKKPQVKCPTCGKLTEYSSSNTFRPFCSERCKLIDLGQWADESYRIADDNDSNSDLLDQEQSPLH